MKDAFLAVKAFLLCLTLWKYVGSLRKDFMARCALLYLYDATRSNLSQDAAEKFQLRLKHWDAAEPCNLNAMLSLHA